MNEHKNVKILHCADVHLDSPFASLDPEKAAIRRNGLRSAFASMMTYALFNEIDIMLMAGDIFDRDFATRETVALILRSFEENKNCRFVIAPGNHDPYTNDSVWTRAVFPDNVYIFDSEQLSYFSFDDLGVDVYGYAFCDVYMEKNPFAGREPENKNRLNLLCAHGDTYDMLSRKCPISESDILKSGFDYVALGHIHTTQGIECKNGVWFGYSGCLEGRDFGECGHKGAVLVEASKTNGKADIRVKGLKFSKRRYETISVNLTGVNGEEGMYAVISSAMGKNYGDDTCLRITLSGSVPPDINISPSNIAEKIGAGLFSLEIKNKTLPLFESDKLIDDTTIRGELFRSLIPILQNGTEEERLTAADALRCGLAALDGSLPANL